MIKLLREIDKLYSGEVSQLELGDTPPDKVDKELETLGYTHDDTESNGWQWDYWAHYNHKEKPAVTLSGSGWYGGTKLRIR